MPLSKTIRAALVAALFLSVSAFAATPYHLELEASPGAVFPYLGRFGDVELHVYEGGVRAEALWLNGFSRNRAADVTVVNPLGRMYVEVPIADIAPTLRKLAGTAAGVERAAVPSSVSVTRGKVGKYEATRHRFTYGPEAYIDVWTTTVVPENPQLRRIGNAMLEGISPGTARLASKLTGNPILIELNFRRFKKVNLLKLKKLTMAAEDERDALTLGSMYMRATVLEKLFEKK
jgi:hypothetical protein